MSGIKKLNLLPEEIKNKYLKKYLMLFCGFVGAVFLIILAIQYINIGVINMQINSIKKENDKYNDAKANIAVLEENIKQYETFIKNYDAGCFPFSEFMYDLEYYRPESVSIISVDTKDRLINEGVPEDADKAKKEVKSEKASKKDEASKKSKEKSDDKGEKSDKKDAENDEATDGGEVQESGKIEYISDLTGQEIVIRGFGSNQGDISDFIYSLTQLSYISNARITAIEEHKFDNGVFNVFEITVLGGAL